MSPIRYIEGANLTKYLRGDSCSLKVWSKRRSNCKGFVWPRSPVGHLDWS